MKVLILQAALLTGIVGFSMGCGKECPPPAPPKHVLGPELRIDPPPRSEVGVPFDMPITYYVPPNRPDLLKTPFEVRAEHNGIVEYQPWELMLAPNKPALMHVTIGRSRSGLAEVLLTSDCCDNPHVTIDTGFDGRVVWQHDGPLESETAHWATMSFVDNTDRPLGLDGPLSIRIDAENAVIRHVGDAHWTTTLDYVVPRGSSNTGPLEIRPTTLTGGRGALTVRGSLSEGGVVLFDTPLTFTTSPPVWLRLLTTIIGALTYSFYQFFRRSAADTKSELRRALLSAMFAGLFAWAFADFNVLGVKTDETRLTGYFVLGLITAYAGVEPLFEKLAQHQKERHEEKPEPNNA